ncbi:unnamed protein product [Microthlaspi erraticum]|uniref:Uncharacterized protein n=1 Tax=Microthlaspi erraticum TaxID=1685480 RepID=A0A6D2HDV6_9BRAS|nr:unnamed protein product [Microthlaspi erraticum]
MQVVTPSSPAPKFVGKERFTEVYGALSDDFGSKLNIDFTNKEEEKNRWWNQEESDDGEEEDEFSFASVNAENSPITADEAFQDGQIRPVYPLFNRNILFEQQPEEKSSLRSPIKKLFVESQTAEEEEETEPMGPYCSWSGRTVEEATPDTCRKSNSTGFSKLWRFKDLVLRSNSDGKDAFVFLNNGVAGGEKSKSSSSSSSFSNVAAMLAGGKRTEKGKEQKKAEKKLKTKSAHERLYMRNRALREEGKRRSYLPYRHVGFFTNVNGLTRNVHPY